MARQIALIRTGIQHNTLRNSVIIKRTITFDGVKDNLRDVAKNMLNAYSRSKTMFADKFVASLSIEEKERVYKLRGLVDEEKVKAIVADSESSVVKRIQQAAATEAEKAEKFKLELDLIKSENLIKEQQLEKERIEKEKLELERAKKKEEEEKSIIEILEDEDGIGRELSNSTKDGDNELINSNNLSGVHHQWDVELGKVMEMDPILGVLLYKMGNRRIYLMDIPTLYNIPVWEKQRVYRKERAKNIADGIMLKMKEQGSNLNSNLSGTTHLPGMIVLYEKAWESELSSLDALQKDDELVLQARRRYGIVDGQHRVGALRILNNEGYYSGRVLVEVFGLQSESEIAELFCNINKAEPVKDVDLPGAITNTELLILDSAVLALRSQFTNCFSTSTKCLKPNVNVDNLRDDIFHSKIISQNKLKTDEDLLLWLLERNDQLAKRSDEEWLGFNKGPRKEAALKKARANNFFLGMDKGWLEEDIER